MTKRRLKQLHAAVHTELTLARRASMDGILHAIDTERDETTAKITAHKTQPQTRQPGQGARLVPDASHDGGVAVGARHRHGMITEADRRDDHGPGLLDHGGCLDWLSGVARLGRVARLGGVARLGRVGRLLRITRLSGVAASCLWWWIGPWSPSFRLIAGVVGIVWRWWC